MTASSYRRRNSMRMPHYDYTSTGAYFVTICVDRRDCVFGDVVDGRMHLSPLGRIAEAAWPLLLAEHAQARLDDYIVMPNHVHLLVWLSTSGLQQPPERAFGGAVAGSLSTLVRAYKSSVTQQANARHLLAAPRLWQRNFYDNILRSDEALARIRDYIRRNPECWLDDQLHPAAPTNPFNRV